MTKAKLPISISSLTIIGMAAFMYTTAPAYADCGFDYQNDIMNHCPMTDEHGDPIWFKFEGKFVTDEQMETILNERAEQRKKRDRINEIEDRIARKIARRKRAEEKRKNLKFNNDKSLIGNTGRICDHFKTHHGTFDDFQVSYGCKKKVAKVYKICVVREKNNPKYSDLCRTAMDNIMK